ncbi:MAG: cyclic nucleotide-binding domain-containing protein, partial [Acidimicrobiia bacterium]|nr:cyclic nucleotide-binding domain-containing protein [Acidimicrobiia bacterium]
MIGTHLRVGERADHVYAIDSGEVKALAESASGKPILLTLIGPDQIVGLLSAFDRGPR